MFGNITKNEWSLIIMLLFFSALWVTLFTVYYRWKLISYVDVNVVINQFSLASDRANCLFENKPSPQIEKIATQHMADIIDRIKKDPTLKELYHMIGLQQSDCSLVLMAIPLEKLTSTEKSYIKSIQSSLIQQGGSTIDLIYGQNPISTFCKSKYIFRLSLNHKPNYFCPNVNMDDLYTLIAINNTLSIAIWTKYLSLAFGVPFLICLLVYFAKKRA